MNNKTKSKKSLTLPIVKKMATVDIIRIVNGKKRITTYTKDEYLLYLEQENERLNNVINDLEKFIEEKNKIFNSNNLGLSFGLCLEILDKLKSLKEGK